MTSKNRKMPGQLRNPILIKILFFHFHPLLDLKKFYHPDCLHSSHPKNIFMILSNYQQKSTIINSITNKANPNMKIAFFQPHFDKEGGSEKYILSIADLLAKKSGHQVQVFSLSANQKKYPRVTPLSPFYLRFPKILQSLIAEFVLDQFLAWHFYWQARREKYELINCHRYPAYIPLAIGKKLGLIRAKLIWTCHEPKVLLYAKQKHSLGRLGPLRGLVHLGLTPCRWIDKWAVAQLDLIIVNSQNTKDDVRRHFNRSSTIINPGIDQSWNHLPEPVEPDPNLILSVGHLTFRKKYDFLIKCFSQVKKKVPTAKLTIIGQGPHRPGLMKLIQNLNLADSVQIKQDLSELELKKLFARAAVYAHPMPSERWGTVLIEAQSFATPVVAINQRGPKEIVNKTHGGLLTNFDQNEFSLAITNLLLNQKRTRQLGHTGRKNVLKFFSWSQSATATEKLFTNILKTPIKDTRSQSDK